MPIEIKTEEILFTEIHMFLSLIINPASKRMTAKYKLPEFNNKRLAIVNVITKARLLSS